MRKLKALLRNVCSPPAWDELDTWINVLLGCAAALLLYATLTSQAVP
jgi:hypothetical protein